MAGHNVKVSWRLGFTWISCAVWVMRWGSTASNSRAANQCCGYKGEIAEASFVQVVVQGSEPHTGLLLPHLSHIHTMLQVPEKVKRRGYGSMMWSQEKARALTSETPGMNLIALPVGKGKDRPGRKMRKGPRVDLREASNKPANNF